MLNAGSAAITVESPVDETITRYPGTGPILLRGRRPDLASRTATRARSEAVEPGWSQLAPPVGSLGYTGSYREPSADVIEVSVVSVLDARGPV
jgi:hypothetical protein